MLTHPPDRFRTERLILRRWRIEDAPRLKAALDASVDHLQPWIPWTVAEPAPLPELQARLGRFVADFDAAREWLYGIFPPDEARVLGGIGLYPRAESGRVPHDAADRVEIGYWLCPDVTGRGYATEATRALLATAVVLRGMTRVEIRCDPRNGRSAAVPQRLGFRHTRTITEAPDTTDGKPNDTMVWEYPAAAVVESAAAAADSTAGPPSA
jgi:RimJ/RimL family protein N-acetyltransferase